MPVIKVDFIKGSVLKNNGATPVDVKNTAFFMLDGYKTENAISEPELNQSSVNFSSVPNQAEISREMNATNQGNYTTNIESANVVPFPIQKENNMTVSSMEETPVNTSVDNIVDNKDKLRILELEKALATANAEINRGMESYDIAQQIIMSALQDRLSYQSEQYQEEKYSKAA